MSLLGGSLAAAQQVRDAVGSSLIGRTLPGDRLIVAPATAPLSEARIQSELPAAAAASWQKFRSAAGQSWQASIDRRNGFVHYAEGKGLPWVPGRGNGLAAGGSTTMTELEGIARSFLAGNADLLGVNPAELRLSKGRSGQISDYLWWVDFDLVRNGLPVEGARVFFRVNNGNLIQFGSENLPSTAAPTPGFLFDRDQALDRLASFVGGLQPNDDFLDRGTQHLVVASHQDLSLPSGFVQGRGYDLVAYWEFTFRRAGEPGTWRGRVDAMTGQILEFVDSNHYSDARGGVYQGDRPSPEVVLPMPFTDISTGGFTDSAGLYSFTGNATTSTLNGQFVRIVDAQCGAISKAADADGNIAFGTSTGTDCITPGVGGAGNTHAARTQFYAVNRNKDVARGWLPGNTWLDQKVNVNVNLNQTCNAYWDGVALNFFKSGGGCANTGELPGVSLHEYGHGLDTNDGNGDSPDFGSAETYGDITGAIATHNSCLGNGFLPSNCAGYGVACTACTGVRDLDWAKRAGNTPHTVDNFTRTTCPTPSANNPNYVGPCGIHAIALGQTTKKREGHCESYVSSESIWDVANRDLPNPGSGAAWTTLDRLWYLSRSTTTADFQCNVTNAVATGPWTSDGCISGSLFRTFRAVDDDDGDLTNGTPHGAAIAAALNRHGIACTTDPAWNVSFAGCTPPLTPTLVTTPNDVSVALSWTSSGAGVVYDVYRNEAGCSAGFTKIANDLPGTTYTDTTVSDGLTYHYQVVPQPAGNEACAAPPSTCMDAVMPAPPGNPTLTAATSVGNNKVKVDWTAGSPPSTLFRVLRTEGTCAAPGPFVVIASGVSGTTYTDPSASSGTSYAYKVSGERSGPSNCLDVTTPGNCLLAPTFAGLVSATNGEAATCGIGLSWSAGTSRCAGSLGYNVYRGTTATFTPAPANQLAANVVGTTYNDTSAVTPGTRYYYVVRAVDLGNGASDVNLVRRTTLATGPFSAGTFTENFEGAGEGFSNAGWSHATFGTAPLIDWVQSSTYAVSTTHSFFANEADHLNDRVLVSPIFKLTGTTSLTFKHKWRFETPTASCFDAATLEAASIDTETWAVPSVATFTAGNPTGTANAGNALGGLRAWCGASTSFTTTFQTATLALGANYPANSTMQVRWHSADDGGATSASTPRGWFLDDVQITNVLLPATCSAGAGCPTITVSPLTALADATQGIGYGAAFSAAGGAGSPTFAVTAGALPAGLTLSGAGGLSGTPSVSGTFFFTVTATDTNGCKGSRSYTLVVNAGAGCPTITLSPAPGALPAGTAGQVYSGATIGATGGSPSYSFAVTSGSLPTGLTLAGGGGISGTPTVTGNPSFTITATDANTCTGSAAYTLAVGCPTITLSPVSLPGGTTGTPYSQTIGQVGGVGGGSFTVTSGALPNGVTLSAGGALTGTPTAGGGFNFTVTFTDANGCTGSRNYTLNVSCPTITLSPAPGALPAGTAGQVYAGATIGASGGSPSYSFAVTSGALPTGLTLASGGGISGTPTVTGNPSFTITATDANTCTGSAAYTLAVGCPTITLSPLTLPDGTTGTAYSQTITQTGGVGSGSFTVTSGNLPTGLTLASGGAITGTPTVSGSYNFTVTFTDANGCTGSRSYAVAIAGWSFHTLAPCRVLDTRNAAGPFGGPSLGSGATRAFLLAGSCGIPVTAHAVSINLTAVSPTAGGSLNVYGAALAVAPSTSALSYTGGVTRANNAVVALLNDGASHDIKIANSIPATVDVIVDVNGYFE